MLATEFTGQLASYLAELRAPLSDQIYSDLYEFHQYLYRANEKLNLTRVAEDQSALLHFADSLSILRLIDGKISRLLDVGTGAGFPGLPLHLTGEIGHSVLIDSSQRKIDFLQSACFRLKLSNISALHMRVEEALEQEEFLESFELIVIRALQLDPQSLFPLLSKQGRIVYMAGGLQELKANLVPPSRVDRFRLSAEGPDRALHVFCRP